MEPAASIAGCKGQAHKPHSDAEENGHNDFAQVGSKSRWLGAVGTTTSSLARLRGTRPPSGSKPYLRENHLWTTVIELNMHYIAAASGLPAASST
jgi:hypothetical protein